MIGALWYLVSRTTWNRVARQLARLKNPRYLAALIIGVAFLWFMLLSPLDGVERPPDAERRVAGRLSGTLGLLGGVYFAIMWIWSWWREKFALALAFQPAEVHTLFSAPLSRRMLLGYKVARSQLFVLFNALIWMALLRRWGLLLPAPLRFATAWVLFTLFSLHRFAVALVRVPPLTGSRRALLFGARAFSIAIAAALVAGVAPVLRDAGSLAPGDILPALGAALERAPAAYALEPFRRILQPLFVRAPEAWGPAFLLVAAAAAAYGALILVMKVEFEEVAAAASADLAMRIAAFRRGSMALPEKGHVASSREWLPLAARGHPAAAIVWKNTKAWVRHGGLRSSAFLVGLATLFTAAFRLIPVGDQADARGIAIVSMMPLFTIFGMSVTVGPRTMRNDLRQDLTTLPLLKTYPLPSAQIMLAEMAAPALALTVFQMALIVAALVAMPESLRADLSGAPVALILALAPFALLALNAASLAIQNATAMLFPGWVKLGPGDGGLEAIGQNLLVTIGQLLVLVLGLLPAAVVAAVVFYAASALGATVAIAAAVMTASGILVAGVVLLAMALGAAFERTEPAAVL